MAEAPRTNYAWMDGELVPWERATVHILTHSLHYGLGVFEGTRAYQQAGGGTAVFRLDDHLRRLFRSARICNLELPFDLETWREATLQLIAANEHDSCYIRHLAFIGAGVMGLYPGDNPIRASITTWPWGAYLGEEGLRRGVRCKISSFARPHPNAAMTKAKVTGNYSNSILAKREVVAMGYEEAILLDTGGFVAECSGENVFIVRDKVVKTPAMTSVLEGITRDSIMQLARDRGYEVREATITRDELYGADEAFMTGTAAEVTPVREVDNRPIGTGTAGPITLELQDLFFRAIRGEVAEYAHWLTPVKVGEPATAVG